MEKKNVNTNLVAALLIVIAVLGYGLIGKAGNLEPSAPPDSTMKTLQEIYDAVGSEGSGVSQREGFCQYLEVPPDSNDVVLTVPAGKRFVLLKLLGAGQNRTDWCLTVNDNLFIEGIIYQTGYQFGLGNIYGYTHDFPDRCVIVNAGDTLKIVNSHHSDLFKTTIIGYYYGVP